MGIKQKNTVDFTVKRQHSIDGSNNLIVIRGGSTIVDGEWVSVPNTTLDLKRSILGYLSGLSNRLFEKVGDVIHILIAMSKDSVVEIIPSISFNKTSYGEIKKFPSLSGKIPLAVVRLSHDGSSDLRSFKEIMANDIEVYQGYGNYTTRGPQGYMGSTGPSGLRGSTGIQGFTGPIGFLGQSGVMGVTGLSIQGATGIRGKIGAAMPTLLIDRYIIDEVVTVDFTCTPFTGDAPHTVDFTDLTIGNVTEWYWDFGDGNTSTEQNPTHIYELTGLYSVTLKVATRSGEVSNNKPDYIVVTSAYYVQDTVDTNDITWIKVVSEDEQIVQDTSEMYSE